MIKLKHDKHNGLVEIHDQSGIRASFSEREFGLVAEEAIHFYLGNKGGFKIVSSETEGTNKGVYYYHLVKNIILSGVYELKGKIKGLFKK